MKLYKNKVEVLFTITVILIKNVSQGECYANINAEIQVMFEQVKK